MNPWTDYTACFLGRELAKAILDWIGTLELKAETGKCAFGPINFYGKI